MLKVFMATDKILGVALRWVSVFCLIILGFTLSAVVFVRWFPVAQLSWSDEVIEWAFAWMVFIGAAALWRDHEHFYVDFIKSKLQTQRVGVYHLLFVEALSILFLSLFLYYSILFTSKADATSPLLRVPKSFWYVCMPISGVIMIGYSVRNIAHLIIKIWQTRQAGSTLNSQTDRSDSASKLNVNIGEYDS